MSSYLAPSPRPPLSSELALIGCTFYAERKKTRREARKGLGSKGRGVSEGVLELNKTST
jgi:hypothetical protein